MTRTHERTPARKTAVQVLYGSAIRNMSALDLLNEGSLECLERPLTDYAFKLIEGVEEHQDVIDRYIVEHSQNWTLDRMPLLDKAILRIALYEMLFVDDVPVSVSINEAVQLAKSFGGEEDSPRFINGMLGTIARQINPEGEAPAADEGEHEGE